MEKIVSINDRLLADAFHITGAASTDEIVRMALTTLIKSKLTKQKTIRGYLGKMRWESENAGTVNSSDGIRVVK